MYISGGDDRLSCKLFPGTLRGVALQWMMNLPPRSIRVFNNLAGLFLSQFVANKSKRLEVADLFDIRQAGGESLKSYMARFNDTTVRKPMSMEEIHVRAEKHVEMEESRFDKREAEHLNKEGRSRPERERPLLIDGRDLHCRQGLNRRQEIPPKFTPLKEKKAHIMQEICHTRLLNFPQAAGGKQMGRNRREWCDFHRTSGHSTKECWTLGAQLEGLVQQGQLSHYVARTRREKVKSRGEPSGREIERNREYDGHFISPRPATTGYRGTISTISEGEESYSEQDDWRRQNAHQSYQVQGVLTWANLTPLGERRRGHTITFQERDRKWRTTDSDEPMVISVVAEDFRIERVLIDQGSSANILYGSMYRKMGLFGLKETPRCLYGFSGERVPIRGTVELDTVFGEGSNAKMIPVLYTVVEAEASYNIIMGRPALNWLKATVSTYHLCMKYPTSGGVRSVWAYSNMTRRCYEDSLRVGQQMSAINTLSLELDPRSSDEHERPHPMEKLKEIQIGLREKLENEDRYYYDQGTGS
ncbi:hypothetical protein CR513_27735, partial [Mucuna pruriens]